MNDIATLNNVLQDKDSYIEDQHAQIQDLKLNEPIITQLRHDLTTKQEEIGVLKARLYLDMLNIEV